MNSSERMAVRLYLQKNGIPEEWVDYINYDPEDMNGSLYKSVQALKRLIANETEKQLAEEIAKLDESRPFRNLTLEEFNRMGIKEQLKVYNQDIETYESFTSKKAEGLPKTAAELKAAPLKVWIQLQQEDPELYERLSEELSFGWRHG